MGRIGPKPQRNASPRAEPARRLSDKILAAFRHAHMAGRVKIAAQLRDVLATNELGLDGGAWAEALGEADRFTAYIEARDTYLAATAAANEDASSVERAYAAMKRAYLRWSSG